MPLFDIQISQDEPVYLITIVSKLVEIPVWTLRQLDKAGIVRSKRIGRKNRFYSLKDIRRLEYVHYLMVEKKVNLHGIKLLIDRDED